MCGGLGYSIGAVYSVRCLRNCLTAESLYKSVTRNNYTESKYQEKESEKERVNESLTQVCNSVVIHVRVRPGPELDFGWPVSTRREDRRCCGKRRGSGQGGRQTLPLVFEGTKLSVQFL